MLPELFYKASLIDLKSASYLDYLQWVTVRSSHRKRSTKTGVLKISKNSQENTCAKVSSLIKLQEACNFIKKETLVHAFSCEFFEIFKITFLTEHFWTIASSLSRYPYSFILRGVFRKQSNIYFGFFLRKQLTAISC